MDPVRKLLHAALLAAVGSGCTAFDENAGPPGEVEVVSVQSSVRVEALEPGGLCAAGGVLVEVGTDTNQNGTLEQAELQSSSPVCNGRSSVGTLVAVLPFETAADCPGPGVVISTGPDSNLNTVLEETEVRSRAVVCEGAGDTGGLNTLACAAGQSPVFDGASWGCGTPATYSGADFALSGQSCTPGTVMVGVAANGNPLCAADADTNTDALAALGTSCEAGQVPRFNGTAFACDDDADSLSGLACPVGNVFVRGANGWECGETTDTLAELDCANGEIPKWNATGGAWACGDDIAGGTAADTLAALSCADAQVAKWNATAGAWECANDVDTNTDTNTDTLADLTCAAGEVAKWNATAGVWECAADDTSATPNTDTLADLTCADGEVAKWNGTAGVWECAADVDTTVPDTNTDALAELNCTDGQITRYNLAAGRWLCASLPVFGTGFETASAEAETTVAVATEVLSHTTGTLPVGTYRVEWSAEAWGTGATTGGSVQLLVDAAVEAEGQLLPSAAARWDTLSGHLVVTFATATTHTLAINVAPETSTSARRARITLWRVQ